MFLKKRLGLQTTSQTNIILVYFWSETKRPKDQKNPKESKRPKKQNMDQTCFVEPLTRIDFANLLFVRFD
jgi:hypothetical protein